MPQNESAVVELCGEVKIKATLRHVKRQRLGFCEYLNLFYFKLNIAILFTCVDILFRSLIHHAFHPYDVFASQSLRCFKRWRVRESYTLHLPAPVAKIKKNHLSLIAANVHPPANRNLFADVLPKFPNKCPFFHVYKITHHKNKSRPPVGATALLNGRRVHMAINYASALSYPVRHP